MWCDAFAEYIIACALQMWVYVNKVLRPQIGMWQFQINVNCEIDSIIYAM